MERNQLTLLLGVVQPTTMNIKIRPYRTGDADALFEAAHESIADVFPWLPWCHPGYKISEVRDWIAMQIESFAKGRQYHFVIASEAHKFLGACGLSQLDSINRSANLGYWVRTSAAGQGVASTAARSVVEWAFSSTEIERIEIVAALKNKQSQTVAEKTGALREGISRSRLLLHDRFHDAVIYSIIKSSWLKGRDDPLQKSGHILYTSTPVIGPTPNRLSNRFMVQSGGERSCPRASG